MQKQRRLTNWNRIKTEGQTGKLSKKEISPHRNSYKIVSRNCKEWGLSHILREHIIKQMRKETQGKEKVQSSENRKKHNSLKYFPRQKLLICSNKKTKAIHTSGGQDEDDRKIRQIQQIINANKVGPDQQVRSSSHIEKLKGIKSFLDQEREEFIPIRSKHISSNSGKNLIIEQKDVDKKDGVFSKQFLPSGMEFSRKYSINSRKFIQLKQRDSVQSKLQKFHYTKKSKKFK